MTWSLSSSTFDSLKSWWREKRKATAVINDRVPPFEPTTTASPLPFGNTALLVQPEPPAPKDWVIFFGHLGYVHHKKSDGRYGIRPVDINTGKDLPNQSTHWPMDERVRIPLEFSLDETEFRRAKDSELPRSMP